MKTLQKIIHLVRLAKRANAAADAAERAKQPSFIDVVNDLKQLGEGGYKFVLLAGVLPTIGYLNASIHFYPAGVTIGDSFFFLMVGLAFGLAYSLFLSVAIAFGFLMAVLFTGPHTIFKNILRCVVVAVVLLAAFALYCGRDTEAAALIGNGLAGFGLSAALTIIFKPWMKRSSKNKRPPDIVVWLIVLLAPVVVSSFFLKRVNENIVMTDVGLRSMNVTLKLSEENYNILSSAAGGQYVAALGCSTSGGGAERMVHGVNLLWHGIGERSLVGIPSRNANNVVVENLLVELKREGIFFFRNYRGPVTRCLEMNGDVLFENGSPSLAKEDRGDLAEMIKLIKSNVSKIEEIQVIGHADALGYKGGAKMNKGLALDRATTIKNLIIADTKFESDKVTAEGHGAREPKTLCKDWPVKGTLSDCLAVNRRVEVRIKFKPEQPEESKVDKSCKCKWLRPASAEPSRVATQ